MAVSDYDRHGYTRTVAQLDRAIAGYDAELGDTDPCEAAIAVFRAFEAQLSPGEICACLAVAVVELIQVRRRDMLPNL